MHLFDETLSSIRRFLYLLLFILYRLGVVYSLLVFQKGRKKITFYVRVYLLIQYIQVKIFINISFMCTLVVVPVLRLVPALSLRAGPVSKSACPKPPLSLTLSSVSSSLSSPTPLKRTKEVKGHL